MNRNAVIQRFGLNITGNAPSVVDLTLCLLPAPGTSVARGRVLSTQTLVPSNPSTPFAGTSQIVDCADVDTLSIQCTNTLGTTKTWNIQGSIDGQWQSQCLPHA